MNKLLVYQQLKSDAMHEQNNVDFGNCTLLASSWIYKIPKLFALHIIS
jgi:hypothetical protein